MSTTVVRGGHVLTMGPAGNLPDGAVAFADGVIVAVGAADDVVAAHPGAEVVGDGTGVVLPGLVNAHTHLSEALICGMAETMSLWEWGARLVAPTGRHLTREMAYVGTLLKGAEMLRTGVTTVSDMFCHTNLGSNASLGVVDGLDELGLRGVASFGAEDLVFGGGGFSGLDVEPGAPATITAILAEHEALAERCGTSARIEFRLGVGVILGQTRALFDASIAASRREGWAVHTHLAEVREEITESRLQHGMNTLGYAVERGLFEQDVLAAHGIWIGDDDIAVLSATGAAVVHNPVANMILASGVCPVPRLRAAGVTVALGTDGPASNDCQDMLQAVKAAALLQKVHHLDAAVITAPEVLRMATIDGARALGLDDRIGSLELGKRADVVHLHGNGAGLANVHDPYQAVVYCAGPHDVGDVWVDGAPLVADGVLQACDLAAVAAASKPLAEEVVTRAGIPELSVLARSTVGAAS